MFDIDRMTNHWRELQQSCDFASRSSHAPSVANKVCEFTGKAGFTRASKKNSRFWPTFEELEETGYSRLGKVLDRRTVAKIMTYFKDRPCYNGHVVNQGDGVGRYLGRGAEDHPFGSYSLGDIIGAPALLELSNGPQFLAAAEQHLGCVPTIYSMNVWWSFPLEFEEHRMTQAFHRDFDDFRFFSFFIYLTDVTEGFGPQQYVPGTHKPDKFMTMLMAKLAPGVDEAEVTTIPAFKKLTELLTNSTGGSCYVGDDRIIELFGEKLETVCAGAGSGFIADPSGFHRAMHPTDGPRLMFWARYGLYPNLASSWDKLKPVSVTSINNRIGTDIKSRYINRMLINFPSDQGVRT